MILQKDCAGNEFNLIARTSYTRQLKVRHPMPDIRGVWGIRRNFCGRDCHFWHGIRLVGTFNGYRDSPLAPSWILAIWEVNSKLLIYICVKVQFEKKIIEIWLILVNIVQLWFLKYGNASRTVNESADLASFRKQAGSNASPFPGYGGTRFSTFRFALGKRRCQQDS